LIGDLEFLHSQAQFLGVEQHLVPFVEHEASGAIEVIDLGNIDEAIEPGQESAATGRASGQYIIRAVELWEQGIIDAIATAPISKNALKLAGFPYPGHTEFLAELTRTSQFAMSFFAEKLRVVLLSTHISLRDAIERVRTRPVLDLIRFSDRTLAELLGRRPKIAVAGLNPHASEGGMFGTEEMDEIAPAISTCRAEGIEVSGPYSPDTIFLRGYRGEFDAVVACYHDQATIAVKSLSFGSSVNVTLGLPLIRTSVDHGTAFDIAGKGIADESSMKTAIRLAAELVQSKRGNLRF
jgi:4-hydroxythreonine-4-phosphate dehydrogenase